MGRAAKEQSSQKLSSLMDEIKSSYAKIGMVSKEDMRQKARVSLVARASNLADPKQLGPAQGQSDQDLLAEIISSEVSTWKTDLVTDCMRIAEKAQIELQSVEADALGFDGLLEQPIPLGFRERA